MGVCRIAFCYESSLGEIIEMRDGRDGAADAMEELCGRGKWWYQCLECITLKEGIHDVGESCCMVGLYAATAWVQVRDSLRVTSHLTSHMRGLHLCLGESSSLRRTTVGVPSAKANNRD